MTLYPHRRTHGYTSNYGSEIDTFRKCVDGIDTWAGKERFVEAAPTGRMPEVPVREPVDAKGEKSGRFRDLCGHGLFIDARKLGRLVARARRELIDEEVARIADTYHAWRGENHPGAFEDVPGFCESATPGEIGMQARTCDPRRHPRSAPYSLWGKRVRHHSYEGYRFLYGEPIL
jgi:hypothetical protein